MHGQQTSGLIDRELAIVPSLDMEMRHTGILLIEKIHLARRYTSRRQMWLFVSAD
jgi:hypothetical protein